MPSRITCAILSMFVLFACIASPVCASGKKRDRSAVLEVPTSGKIMDVVYQPEFDEWWVKCREGDTICVYSYDARAREWGKILFVPKKPDDKTKIGIKDKPAGDKAREKGAILPDKIEEPKSGQTKDASKGDGKPAAKWWDPFKILKQGENIIRQPWNEGGK